MDNLHAKLKLGELIGQGYFGKVYLASDPIHNKVAVKVLEKKEDESETDWHIRKKELLVEGQRLKDAEHLNVVRVLHILEHPSKDSIYLAMEYCQHGCLSNLYEQGPLPVGKVRDYMTDASLGLQVIHARGMLHRDIKPSNILLDSKGRAKIGDFGLVTDSLIFGYASRKGYLDHLAPEAQVQGLTSISTDIWAFGMTTYRLLHGHDFYKEKLNSPRMLVREGKFAQKLPWLPHISDDWKRFIRKAMNDDPQKRFHNTAELLQGLHKLSVDPSWDCKYGIDEVMWEREKGARKIEVFWKKYSPRKQEWVAKSYPINGSGRERTIARTEGLVTEKVAFRTLHEYFMSSK